MITWLKRSRISAVEVNTDSLKLYTGRGGGERPLLNLSTAEIERQALVTLGLAVGLDEAAHGVSCVIGCGLRFDAC